MAKTIPQLTDATTVNAADELIISQGGITKRATGAELATGLAPLVNSANGTVNVKDYGAVGDGVADDTAAIQAAINSGKTIIEGAGLTYKTTVPISVPSNVMLQNFVFDMTSLPDSSALYFGLQATGSIGSSLSLTANATGGFGPNPSIALSSGDAATLSAGDLIYITSSVDWSSGTKIGELAEVLSVSSGTVSLQSPLTYSYATTDSAVVRKITPAANITVRNCTATGPSAITGSPQLRSGFFGVLYGKNITVENCRISNFQRSGVEFRRAYQCWMRDCVVKNIINYYGCSIFDASCYVSVTNNVFENCRHAVSCESSSTYGGVNNYIAITGNHCNGRDAALDCHPPADNVIFANNVCRGEGKQTAPSGVFFQGRNAVISGNTINGNLNNGITVQPFVTAAGYAGVVSVSGNVIDLQRANIATTIGVYYQASNQADCLPAKAVVISGNMISGTGSFGVYVQNTTNAISPASNVCIGSNSINGFGWGIGFRTDANAGTITACSVTGNVIANPDASSSGILFRPNAAGNSISAVSVTGNTFALGASSVAIEKLGSGSTTGILIDANVYSGVTTPIDTDLRNYVIAAGVITVTGDQRFVQVDTESAAASDDLDTVSGGQFGQVVTFVATNAARTVVFKDGTGNLRLSGDFTADNSEDSVTCVFNGTNWIEIARSDNGA